MQKDCGINLLARKTSYLTSFIVALAACSSAVFADSFSASMAPARGQQLTGVASPLVSATKPLRMRAQYGAAVRNSQGRMYSEASTAFADHGAKPGALTLPSQVSSTVQTTDMTLGAYGPPANPLNAQGVPTNTPLNIDPVWSHDETFIVFVSNRVSAANSAPDPSGHLHLYALSATGDPKTLVQLTSGPTNERFPTLLGPTDSRIAFVQNNGSSFNAPYSLVVGAISNSQAGFQVSNAQTLLTPDPASSGNSLAVSHPSYVGDTIAFSGTTAGGQHHIYVISVIAGTVRQITAGGADEENPAFDPTGQLIAFDSNATGYSITGGLLQAQGTSTTTRDIYISSFQANSVEKFTATPSGHVSKQPSWSQGTTNPYLNPNGGRLYIFFASDRIASTPGTSDIFFLRAQPTPAYNATIDVEGTDIEGIGTSVAVQVNTSDPNHVYDDEEPAVSSLVNFGVIYASQRLLGNTRSDNPLSPNNPFEDQASLGSVNPQIDREPLNFSTSGQYEIFQSRIVDVEPPSLLKYDESANEIVHVEDVAAPGVATRFVPPTHTARFIVRVSDRQSGVGSLYLQIKDPDSKYQDGGHLEHKVFTHNPFGFRASEFDESTTAYAGGAIAGFINTAPILLGTLTQFNVSTTLAAPAAVGASAISVVSPANLQAGQYIIIGNGGGATATQEIARVTGVTGQTVFLAAPLTLAHAAGEPVVASISADQLAAAAAAAATTITVTNGSQFNKGDTIQVDVGTKAEIVTISAISANTLTVSPLAFAHSAGAPVLDIGSSFVDAFGQEVDAQELLANTSPFDASLATNYKIPRYAPTIDDALPLSVSNDNSPASAQPADSAAWLQLTPLPATQQDALGGVLYSATWQTPAIPSDYYIDVVAYDNAKWPVPYRIGTIFDGGHINWRIYDNVWGLTTANFAGQHGILVVNDYALPQKFYLSQRFGLFSPQNIPVDYYGAESYITDIDINPADALTSPSVLPNVAILSSYVSDITKYGPIVHPSPFYAPAYGNGLGVNSYTDEADSSVLTVDGGNVAQSQQYDIWRVLARGPVPDTIIAAYLPRTENQPANPLQPGSAPHQVQVAQGTVLWVSPFSGDQFVGNGTITDQATQTQLSNFVSSGGRLFVSGADIGYALTSNGGQPNNTFYSQVLRAKYDGDSLGALTVTGAGGKQDRVSADAFINTNHFRFQWFAPIPTYAPPYSKPLHVGNFSPTTLARTDASIDSESYVDGYATTSPLQLTELSTGDAKLTYYIDPKTHGIVTYSSLGLEAISQEAYQLGTSWGIYNQRTDLLHNLVCFTRTGTIFGRITSSGTAGQPLGGATVVLSNGTDGVSYVGTTDAGGRYQVDGLPPGFYFATAYKPGYIVQHGSGGTVVHGAESGSIDLQLVPAPNGGLKILVTDRVTGLPVTGAIVTAVETTGAVTYGPTPTNTNGEVDFNSVLSATYNIFVDGTPVGYGTASALGQVVQPGATTVVNIKLGVKPGQISGLVTISDPGQPDDNKPIANATVTATVNGKVTGTAVTNASGIYLFTNVQAGVYTLTASATGYVSAGSATVTVAPGQSVTANLQVLHAPLGTVYGLVSRSFDGQAVSGAIVTFKDPNNTDPKYMGFSVATGSTFTGPDGQLANYTLAGVPAGTYAVTLNANGYPPAASQTVTVPGSSAVRVDFKLNALHVFNAGLQMFSVPYDYSGLGLSLDSIFGYGGVKLAVWQPSVSAYAVTPQYPADTIRLGQAYWARFPQNVGLLVQGKAAPNPSSFTIGLTPSWNMVGDPFTVPVTLSNIQVIDVANHTYTWAQATSAAVHLVGSTIYSYDQASNTYQEHFVGKANEPQPQILPYSGYWVQVYGAVALVMPPK